MSKRTTSTSKPSDVPAARRRTTKPAAEAPSPAQPRTPRVRRATTAPADAAIAADLGVTVLSAASRRPTHDEIATRAYYIAQARGFQSDPLSDWLAAERELAKA